MRTLFLARHALAASNRSGGVASGVVPGHGLTDEGAVQARRLGAELQGEAIDLGVSTEFLRTRETLELALDGRHVPRIIVPELNEIQFGSFDGGPLADYRAWAAQESPATRAPGGGDSRANAAERFARGLRVLLARPEDAILAIGHALLVRYVLDAARGLVPAPLMLEPVEHAVPHRLEEAQVAKAASLLEEWCAAPRFRDPPNEG